MTLPEPDDPLTPLVCRTRSDGWALTGSGASAAARRMAAASWSRPAAAWTVTSVRPDKPICTLAVSVRNQHGDVCLSGTATTYTAALLPAVQ